MKVRDERGEASQTAAGLGGVIAIFLFIFLVVGLVGHPMRKAPADKIAISMLRADRMLEALKAKKISTGTKYKKQGLKGRQETELYEVKDFMGGGTTEFCLKMKHPSLDQEYIEWVEPEVGKKKDADLAQAVAFGWTKEQYMSAVEA